MKFTVNSKLFLQALQSALPAISSSPVLPVLENFLIQVDTDNSVLITASNLSMQIDIDYEGASVDSDVAESFAVPAKLLVATLKTLGDQPIVFSYEGEGLHLQSASGVYELPLEDSEDFPRIGSGDLGNSLVLTAKDIENLKTYSLPFVATDEFKVNMQGVYFGKGEFCATDSHKLTVIGNDLDLELPFTVSTDCISALQNKDYGVKYDINHIRFEDEGFALTARLIDEKFPDYKNVIPKENPLTASLSADEVLKALAVVSLYTNKGSNLISLAFDKDNNRMIIEGADIDYSMRAKESVHCNSNIDSDFIIGFNCKFLQALLATSKGQNIKLSFSTPQRPCIVSSDTEGFVGLVMPVMLNNQY